MQMLPSLRLGVVAGLVLLVAGICCAQTDVATAGSAAGGASAPTHRPLRENIPVFEGLPQSSPPEVFSGYPGAPAYTVEPRKPAILLYPCSMCHNLQKLNTTVRQLRVAPDPAGAPHSAVLVHGKGRMWCLDCHFGRDREWLHRLDGSKLDFNDAPLLCGQCHSARYKDWVFGAHGKRVAGWTGERELYACTHCHDPHNPVIQPRQPGKPPPLRAGLRERKPDGRQGH